MMVLNTSLHHWLSLLEFAIPLQDTIQSRFSTIMIKYNQQFLNKIEEVFEENAYQVRYEKGNFKSGFCIIEDRKMVVINKFAAIESRINTLIEIIRSLGAAGILTGEKYEAMEKEIAKHQKMEERAG